LFFCIVIHAANKPNILLILADDLGYSDIGCFGSEIETPNLDSLASKGVRFSRFYNCAKCAPSRSSLLTGVYPQNNRLDGAWFNGNVTIPQLLGDAGYKTYVAGKWHNGTNPLDYGFDEFFGFVNGHANFFKSVQESDREVYYHNRSPWTYHNDNFYATTGFTDSTLAFINRTHAAGEPFFAYLAYNAPHFPLHALPQDIAKYKGKYMEGWDKVRLKRYEKLKQLGLIEGKDCELTVRDEGNHHRVEAPNPAWTSISNNEEEDNQMAVYAAMIDCMDQNIGRILDDLKSKGILDNTLVLFMSDNGGCPYSFDLTPDIDAGPADTWRAYLTPWANVSNTPFRSFKRFTHEGGIASPMIVSWPSQIQKGNIINHQPAHLIDIMATCIDAAEVDYPSSYNSQDIVPLQGVSLKPVVKGEVWEGHKVLFWEHNGSKAVLKDGWKLVLEKNYDWELYNTNLDRSEMKNLIQSNASKATELENLYNDWEFNNFDHRFVGTKEIPVENEMAWCNPNPATVNTIVHFALGDISKMAQFNVFDMNGKLIDERTISAAEYVKQSLFFNCAYLKKGTYIFLITNGSSKQTVKFIKL
ncbi:MAG: sulfatase-like hydrolase/transferase, partial [Bacteroidales bacterium]|nr:sulfatase-like hydrolase/transferase [Bacteroidales bacterium]